MVFYSFKHPFFGMNVFGQNYAPILPHKNENIWMKTVSSNWMYLYTEWQKKRERKNKSLNEISSNSALCKHCERLSKYSFVFSVAFLSIWIWIYSFTLLYTFSHFLLNKCIIVGMLMRLTILSRFIFFALLIWSYHVHFSQYFHFFPTQTVKWINSWPNFFLSNKTQ